MISNFVPSCTKVVLLGLEHWNVIFPQHVLIFVELFAWPRWSLGGEDLILQQNGKVIFVWVPLPCWTSLLNCSHYYSRVRCNRRPYVKSTLWFTIWVLVTQWFKYLTSHQKDTGLTRVCCSEVIFLRYELEQYQHIVHDITKLPYEFACKIHLDCMVWSLGW